MAGRKLTLSCPDMHAYSYISQATRPLDQLDLPGIVADARAFNTAHGLTGMLLYTSGKFMQMLEGPADAVEQARLRIELSERHDGVMVLQDEGVTERLFADWAMAAQDDTDLGAVRRAVDACVAQAPSQLTATQRDVLRMMRGFLDWERYASAG